MNRLLLLLLLIPFAAGAQNFDPARMDTLLRRAESHNKIMGSLAIYHKNQLVYERAIGFAGNKGTAFNSATTQTEYRIGSITKTFTTALVFQQIEAGRLSLNSKLSTWFPSIQNADSISIAQMLQHRSGIYNITNDTAYSNWNTKPQTSEALIARMIKGGSVFKPGTKSEYSNSNFILLGMILEKITGKPYPELLRSKITQPLGLKSTFVFGPKTPQESDSYIFTASGWTPETVTDASVPGGAGNIVSTASDIARFYTALFNGKVVSEKSLDEMKLMKDGYGKGLFLMPFYDHISYGHTGGIDAFSSMAGYFPGDSMSFAFCSNGTNYSVNNLMIGVLSIYFNKPYKIPSFESQKVDPAKVEAYTGTYANDAVPMKITVRVKGGRLEAQATGQGAFPLEPLGKDSFRYETADITITFNTEKKTMSLLQNGDDTVFTKE